MIFDHPFLRYIYYHLWTTDWFQIGKGVRQGCILSPCYLTYMQSTSREMLDWKKHKMESRLLGEISADDTTLWQKVKRN